jgi:hypothetical protein
MLAQSSDCRLQLISLQDENAKKVGGTFHGPRKQLLSVAVARTLTLKAVQ